MLENLHLVEKWWISTTTVLILKLRISGIPFRKRIFTTRIILEQCPARQLDAFFAAHHIEVKYFKNSTPICLHFVCFHYHSTLMLEISMGPTLINVSSSSHALLFIFWNSHVYNNYGAYLYSEHKITIGWSSEWPTKKN